MYEKPSPFLHWWKHWHMPSIRNVSTSLNKHSENSTLLWEDKHTFLRFSPTRKIDHFLTHALALSERSCTAVRVLNAYVKPKFDNFRRRRQSPEFPGVSVGFGHKWRWDTLTRWRWHRGGVWVLSVFRVDLLRAPTRSSRIFDSLLSIFILNSWRIEEIVVQKLKIDFLRTCLIFVILGRFCGEIGSSVCVCVALFY